jgi:hypothetical protein
MKKLRLHFSYLPFLFLFPAAIIIKAADEKVEKNSCRR